MLILFFKRKNNLFKKEEYIYIYIKITLDIFFFFLFRNFSLVIHSFFVIIIIITFASSLSNRFYNLLLYDLLFIFIYILPF